MLVTNPLQSLLLYPEIQLYDKFKNTYALWSAGFEEYDEMEGIAWS